MPDASEDSDEREGTSDEGFYVATVGQAAGEQRAATNLEDCTDERL
jgi:hypothetical protein